MSCRAPAAPRVTRAAALLVALLTCAPYAAAAEPTPAPAESLIGRVVAEVRLEAPADAFRANAERRYMLGLLGMAAGSRLSRAALRQGIENLYRTGKWRGIAVEGTPVGDDRVALRLVLEPVERVGHLRFEGPRKVTRAELERVIQLAPGQEFRPETVARATRAIQDYLDRLGYPDAVVVATSRPFGEPYEREVTFTLAPNEPCRLAAVRVEGALGLPEAELRRAAGIEPGDQCSRVKLDAAVDRLGRRYREAGYLEAVVSQARLDYGPERRTATAVVTVRAGEPIELVFQGHRHFSSSRFREALELGEQPDVSSEGLSLLADRLVDFYRKRAYAWAAVSVRAEPKPDAASGGGRRLVFRIVEGPRVRVRGVAFRGNAQIRARRLRDQMVTRPRAALGLLASGTFLQAEFEEDLEAIRTFYRQQGFLDVRISDVDFRFSPDRTRMWITITIDEGPRYFLVGLDLEGAGAIPAETLRRGLPLAPGRPFSLADVDRAVESIVQRYATQGYLQARVVPDIALEPSPPSARVRLVITEGPKVTVGTIVYRGNFYTRTRVLQREMAVKTGDPYNPAAVLESQRNIGRLGLFRNVAVRPANEAAGAAPGPAAQPGAAAAPGARPAAPGPRPAPGPPADGAGQEGGAAQPGPRAAPSPAVGAPAEPPDRGPREAGASQGAPSRGDLAARGDGEGAAAPRGPVARDLLVTVEEADRVDLSFGFDYSLEERLRVFGEVTHRGLFGTDRSVALRGVAGGRESLYALEYRQPHLFDVRLDGRIALTYQDREEKNFSFRRSAVTTSVQRDLRRDVKVSFAYEFESTKVFDVAPGTIISPRDIGTIRIGTLRPVLVWDRRDDPFNPTRGFLNTLSTEVANQAFLSEVEFVRLIAGSAWFFPLERTRRVVLGVSLRAGYAVAYGASDDVPLIRRFFLGGATTVRGFDRDEISPRGPDGAPTGGTVSFNENLELRFPLPFGFGGAVFLDAGNVWLDTASVDLLDQRAAYGVGLRYLTPVGPIRLDYGRKVDRKPGESPDRFHFSIGYVF